MVQVQYVDGTVYYININTNSEALGVVIAESLWTPRIRINVSLNYA